MAHARQAVDTAVQAAPPRHGLEASIKAVTGSDRWEDGIKWQPEQCAGAGRIAGTDACSDLDAVSAGATPALAESDPFLVFAGEKCSTIGGLTRDWEGRARRQLNATRSAQIAAELWGGSLAGAGLALVDATSDTLTAGPVDPVDALAVLEAGLAHYLAGRQGMIHATPQVLTHLVRYGVARLEGPLWLSPNGHVIVADAGYPGTGPTGAAANFSAQWMYGTAVVGLRLTPIVFNPGALDGNGPVMAAALDRSTNLITVIAQQVAVLQLDPCAHVAAQVAVAPPAIGGAS